MQRQTSSNNSRTKAQPLLKWANESYLHKSETSILKALRETPKNNLTCHSKEEGPHQVLHWTHQRSRSEEPASNTRGTRERRDPHLNSRVKRCPQPYFGHQPHTIQKTTISTRKKGSHKQKIKNRKTPFPAPHTRKKAYKKRTRKHRKHLHAHRKPPNPSSRRKKQTPQARTCKRASTSRRS